jgi:hypothetical protein
VLKVEEGRRRAAEDAERQRLSALKAEDDRKEAAEEAERQRLAVLKVEEGRRRAAEDAERQRLSALKAEDDRKEAAEEAERQRLAALKAEDDRKRAAEDTERQRLAALKVEEDRRKMAEEAERQRWATLQEDRSRAQESERQRPAAIETEQQPQPAEKTPKAGEIAALAGPPVAAPTRQEPDIKKASIPKAEPGTGKSPWNGTWTGTLQAGPFAITIADNKVVYTRWLSTVSSQSVPKQIRTIRATDKTISFVSGNIRMTMRLDAPGRATLAFGRAVAAGGQQTWQFLRSRP